MFNIFKRKPDPNPLHQPTITPTNPGGFILCKEAQPPFDTEVIVMLESGFALAKRTREIDQASGQEKWSVAALHKCNGAIFAWKPI